jgi:hypothetical protein
MTIGALLPHNPGPNSARHSLTGEDLDENLG